MGPTVHEAKERLLEATVGARLDEAWARGGMERLYFDHPTSRRVAGSIELDTTVEKVNQVRIELLVPPDLAGRVIEFVQTSKVDDVPVELPVETKADELPIPPTRDPGPDDMAEMVAEEQEGDGLPAEVVMPEESL